MGIYILGLDMTRWLIFIFGILIVVVSLRKLAKNKQKYTKILFLLPAFIWIISFIIYPLMYSFYLSFFNWQGRGDKTFVGFLNYLNLMKDYKVGISVFVTARFIAIAVTLEVALGLLYAILVFASKKGSKFFRTLFLIPLFVPPVAIAFLSFMFFHEHGPLNSLLNYIFGIAPVAWTSNPKLAPFTIILLDIWEWTPFCFIIILAALHMVPDELIEAAYINTNSPFTVFRWVTLPFIKPVLITVVLLRTIEAIKIFDIPFALTYGGPGLVNETYSINTYKTALKYFELGYGSSIAFMLLVTLLVVFNLVFRFTRFAEIYE
ncbi:MAG: carbohydrate ABC transporter permease [Desulfobaccales bacterium]